MRNDGYSENVETFEVTLWFTSA